MVKFKGYIGQMRQHFKRKKIEEGKMRSKG
jgi:hypothetical protein